MKAEKSYPQQAIMQRPPPKDRKATDRKRSEGVISKAHQYAKICKGEIAVFIRNQEGKCKIYQSSDRNTWRSFFQQLKKEESHIINITPEDLDDNGKKKKKRITPSRKTHSARYGYTLPLPKFPLIKSESEEWLHLDKNTNSFSQDGQDMGGSALKIPNIPKTISLDPSSEFLDVIPHFPEPPVVDFCS